MKKTVSIIGGGPSALLLAAFLDASKFDIVLYEKNNTVGRKFLVAGKGGFNLTHSEPMPALIARYTPVDFLQNALETFTNTHFREWLDTLGIETFVGSSKRVYPVENVKPIQVLNAMVKVLEDEGVRIHTKHTFTGWNKEKLVFNNTETIQSDYTVFALGGGSWKITGSDGSWQSLFAEKNIDTLPFSASNCAYGVAWPKDFIAQHAGTPLKNSAIRYDTHIQKGEAVFTQFGIEGNAIYGLSPFLREAFKTKKPVCVHIDFKPVFSEATLLKKIQAATEKNTAQILKKTLKLTSAQIALLKNTLSKEAYLEPALLAQGIKNCPLQLTGPGPLDEAISTTGGLPLNAVDANFQLQKLPNHYAIGELLDWDAPTGGYLLQACASMGVALAKHLNQL